MKLRRIASSLLVGLLLVSMYGVMLVFAPPPTTPTLPIESNVFVTNTSDDPVPVDITDEPIEVTNPSGQSLDVSVPDGVEVTNLDDIELDVSGWLHTTESGRVVEMSVTTDYYNMITIDTKGFRQLTINYYTYGDDCEFLLYMNVWTAPSSSAGIDVKSETVSSGNPTAVTYDVISDFVHVFVTPKTGGPTIVAVTYYMTT